MIRMGLVVIFMLNRNVTMMKVPQTLCSTVFTIILIVVIEVFLDRAKPAQKEEGEQADDDGDFVTAIGRGSANDACTPDAGGGGSAAHGAVIFENSAAADEANTGHQTLNDARLGIAIVEADDVRGDENEGAASHGDEGKGAQAH